MTLPPVVELTKKLIAIPSDSMKKQDLRTIITFVQNYLEVPGVVVKVYESNGFHSLVATFEDTLNPTCMLSGHLDVVGSRNDGYEPIIVNNRLYGRGSGDMKSADAVMIEVFKQIALDESIKNKPSVGLMLTTDEEMGGFNGVHYLLEKIGFHAKVAVVPDTNCAFDTLIMSQKGLAHIKVWAEGHAAHGSRPHLGESAIKLLMEMMKQLEEELPLEKNKDEWGITMNVGKMEGGLNVNQVPDYAYMEIDFRFTHPDDFDEIIHVLKKVTKGRYELHAEGFPVVVDESNEWVQSFVASMKEVVDVDAKFDKESGASDARFFANKGIKLLLPGIRKGNTHADHEWVDIEDMLKFEKTLKHFLLKI